MLEYLNNLCILFTWKFNNFIEEEKGAVDLVTIIVLIAIAVVLAVAFKNAISKVLQNLFTNISQNASSVTTAETFNVG